MHVRSDHGRRDVFGLRDDRRRCHDLLHQFEYELSVPAASTANYGPKMAAYTGVLERGPVGIQVEFFSFLLAPVGNSNLDFQPSQLSWIQFELIDLFERHIETVC